MGLLLLTTISFGMYEEAMVQLYFTLNRAMLMSVLLMVAASDIEVEDGRSSILMNIQYFPVAVGTELIALLQKFECCFFEKGIV